MNPLDILTKPTNINPALFQPKGAAPAIPTPSLKPVSPLSFVSNPLPTAVVQKVQTATPAPVSTPAISTKNPLSILSNPLPPSVTSLFTTPDKTNQSTVPILAHEVRKQDLKDLGNLPFQLLGGFVSPAVSTVLNAKESITGKPSTEIKLGVPFPHKQTVTDGDYTHQIDLEAPAFEAIGAKRRSLNLQAEGATKEEADKQAALEGALNLAFAIPVFRSLGKFGVAKLSPASLIEATKTVNPQEIKLTKEAIFDYFSGRRSAEEIGIPKSMRESIARVVKEGTNAEKKALLNGLGIKEETLQAKPSELGQLLGVSQAEADTLLKEVYGGPKRSVPVAGLPGYKREAGQGPKLGLSTERVEKVGGAEEFKGFNDITTHVLDNLEGKSTVSKQFISDLTNKPELKQAERDVIRTALADYPDGSNVPVKEFADKVHAELLPLEVTSSMDRQTAQYEQVSLPEDLRGEIQNYEEKVYGSPGISTSAGDIHFGHSGTSEYFGHTRVEELPDNTTNRVIEIQSDLYQKGRLSEEGGKYSGKTDEEIRSLLKESNPNQTYSDAAIKFFKIRGDQALKLEQYSNPTAHFRIVREEIKSAAKDGKTKLQFPTGETAMKIEGLGNHAQFVTKDGVLKPDQVEVGKEITFGNVIGTEGNKYIIVANDPEMNGRFFAVPERLLRDDLTPSSNKKYVDVNGVKKAYLTQNQEGFDISGKVDTNNPIYKFYEKELGRYLQNKYDAKLITDPQGVKWWEVNVDKSLADKPVSAYKKSSRYNAMGRGPMIETSKVADLLKEFVTEDKVKLIFNPKLLKEEGNLGEFRTNRRMEAFNPKLRPVIELYEKSGKVYVRTAFHEAYHYLEEKVFRPEFVQELDRRTLEIMTKFDHQTYDHKLYNTPEKRAAEYRADEFAKEQASKKGYTSPIHKILDKIRAAIKKIADAVKKVVKDIKKTPNKQGGFIRLGKYVEPTEPPFGKGSKRKPEVKVSQRDIEEANTELNRVFEQQALSKKITILKNRLDLLREEKDMIAQALESHPGKELVKYVSRETGELAEISPGGKGKFGKRGDVILENIENLPRDSKGFRDVEQGQKAVDEYKNIRESYFDINTKINQVRKELGLHRAFETVIQSNPAVKVEYQETLKQIRRAEKQTERNLQSQGSLSDTPSKTGRGSDKTVDSPMGSLKDSLPVHVSDVKPPEGRGGVTPPALDFLNWTDKPALSLSRETFERNIESVAGKDAPAIKKFMVDPVRKNETNRIDWVNGLRRGITKKVVKGFGIRAKSEESKLVQQYGEKQFGATDEENLDHLRRLRPNDWHRIKETADDFRAIYDTTLDKWNGARAQYGYPPVPKRPDYFRHFQAIDSAIRQFGMLLRQQDLPTEIAGITGIFNPNKPFSTAELRRKGEKSTEDAIRGMDNYLDSVSRQIFHIDSVTRGRQLEKYIRESAKVTANHTMAGPGDAIKLPNFVSNLHDYTNILSGKKAALDRALESIFGRRIYSVSNFIRRRIGANMVLGNLASAITNFAPFTQSLATTSKPAAIHGLGESLMSPWHEDYPLIDGVQSDFLLRRFPEKAIDLRGVDKAGEKAGWLFEQIDRFTAKSITAGKYYENIEKGMGKEEAMKSADAYAGRILADRSIGQTPNIFNSQSLGFITQFQTEVNNVFSFMTKDIPRMSEGKKSKLFTSLMQFLLYSYLFNEGYKRVTGRRPLLDPIYASLTLLGKTDESEDVAFSKRLSNTITDVGGNLPFVGGITGGRFPISGSLPDVKGLINGDTTATKELIKLAYLVPPFGGGQLKKTFEGLNTVRKGEERTPSGKTVRYRVDQTPINYARAGLFGKSSLPQAQEYYKGIDKKYSPAKPSASGGSKLSGIKLIPKGNTNIKIQPKSNLSGIKLVPKKKINIKK